MERARLHVHGNPTRVWAHDLTRFGDSGAVATRCGIDAFTLMKHDGEWKVVARCFTDE